jgi:hypothetical protein
LALHRNGGETQLEEARACLEAALLGNDWRDFSDYLDTTGAFADMETTSRLIHFLLRMIRLFHRLEALEGRDRATTTVAPATGNPAQEYAWTADALRSQGFDPGLAPYLGPLEIAPDLIALSGWLEEILAAVQSYAKPKVAALGLYLDFESKHARKEA